MIKMLPNLNYDSKDPKFNLLDKIFKINNSKKKLKTHATVKKKLQNIKMMVNSIKIQLITIYFNYTVSDVVNELNPSTKLRKICRTF